MRRSWASGFALIRVPGGQALRAGLPTYLALLLPAYVVFAGNGLEPVTVVGAARINRGLLLTLYAGWLLVSHGMLRALMLCPQAQFLRPLPIPRALLVGGLWSLGVLFQLPWLVLWGVGGGAVTGLAAACTALCLSMAWVGAAYFGLRVLVGLLVLAALLTTAPYGTLGAWLLLPVAMLGSLLNVHEVWQDPPARTLRRNRLQAVHTPGLALLAVNVLLIWRRKRTSLAWCLSCALLAAAAVAVGSRHHWLEPSEQVGKSVAFAAPSLVFLSTVAANCVVEQERQLAWLHSTLAVSSLTRRLTAQLSVVAWVVVLSGGFSLFVLGATAMKYAVWWDMAVQTVLLGCAVGSWVYHALRALLRQSPRDARSVLLIGVLGMTFALVVPLLLDVSSWLLAVPVLVVCTTMIGFPRDNRSAFLWGNE